MDEEKSKEKTGDSKKDRDRSEKAALVEQTNEATKGLEQANKEKQELLDREEKLLAKREQAGMAEAGMIPPKPKEETAEEYSERVLKGDSNPLEEDGFV